MVHKLVTYTAAYTMVLLVSGEWFYFFRHRSKELHLGFNCRIEFDTCSFYVAAIYLLRFQLCHRWVMSATWCATLFSA